MLGICLTLGLLTAPPAWEARYTCFANLTEAQKADGWIPGWKFTQAGTDDDAELTLDGDDDGGLNIGQVYLGHKLELTTPLPRFLTISLELQAACSETNRSPSLNVLLLSAEAWDQLATDPAKASAPPPWAAPLQLARQSISYPEDTTEWLAWASSNLATRLRPSSPTTVYVVLAFSGNHAGGHEWAKFRKVKIQMSDTVPEPPERQPQWPLKTAQTLLTDDEIALARQRVAEDEDAAKLRDGIVKAAAQWLSVPDEDLAWRVPDASVPRAFNVSAHGCPVHGTDIYRHGTYPWILHFDRPYEIECPVGHEVYSTGDFAGWLQGGRRDTSLIQRGDYPDDGWGWVAPNGERYWLVAYACHWHWNRYILPGLRSCAQAYVLTGDERYAHKAAATLARIAEVYPAMEYESQSRYGSLVGHYPGKILNHIWETGTVRGLAEAYDAVWSTIDSDTLLQQELGRSGEEIRAAIESRLLEEAIDGVLQHKIEGNYGMHQSALAALVAVRQNAPSAELLTSILDRTGSAGPYEGVRFALYNWVHRDGVPYETSPGYNFGWVSNLDELARIVARAGIDLFAEPMFSRLMHWPYDLTVNSQFMPAEGDAGDIRHGKHGRSFDVYYDAFQHYGGGDFASMFEQSGGLSSPFRTYDSLFLPSLKQPLEEALAAHPRQPEPTRVLDGYGMAILNNPVETVGVQHYYGWRGGHSHRDGLTFDLYAHGQPVTPDTGYPDFMNSFVAGIYSWSKATIAHNTVTIDAKQQTGNAGGQVRGFGASPTVQYIDVEAPGNYPACREYRRALTLVSTDEQNGYLLDVFRCGGGTQHDYSLHGTVGQTEVLQGSFSAPQTQGTLAGENVEVGQLYDDPVLGAPGYKGGFGGYVGSGFQHLVRPRRQTDQGPVTIQVTPETDPKTRLRVHLLPQAGQQAILAEAQISPLKHPEMLPYLLARRTGENLQSTFVSVLEPFAAEPLLTGVEALPCDGDGVALKVQRADGFDVILQARDGAQVRHAGGLLASDAPLTVARFTADGAWRQLVAYGGTTATVAGRTKALRGVATGEVTAVDPKANTITVRWDGQAPATDELIGHELFCGNAQRDNLFRVTAAEPAGGGLRLTLEASLLCGRGRVTGVADDGHSLTTDTAFKFLATYPGMRLLNEQQEGFQPLVSCDHTTFRTSPDSPPLAVGDPDEDGLTTFWVCVLGPGDRVRLPRTTILSDH